MSGRLLLDPATGLPLLIGGQLMTTPQPSTPPTVAVLAASPVVAVLEGESAVLRVAVEPPLTDDLTFTYATASGTAIAGTDFSAITDVTGTIPAGRSYVDLLIPTISRVGTNGSRSFAVAISNALAGEASITLSNATATITIADVGVGVVLPTLGFDPVTTQDEGTSLVFTVRASKTHSADVSFTYTTVDGTAVAGVDYTTQAGGKTITSGLDSVTITVPTTARAGYQGARALSVLISAATDGTNTIEIHTASRSGVIRDTEVPVGEHAYYDAFIAHPNYYTGASMRPVPGQPLTYPTGHPHAGKRNPYYEKQLLPSGQGGYSNHSSQSRVTYSPSTDTHPFAQDAMKTLVHTWVDNFVLKTAMSAETTTVHAQITTDTTFIENGTSLLIDDEAMLVTSSPNATGQPSDGAGGRYLTVTRGYRGTAAVIHPTTSFVRRSNNSIWPQWRPPIGTTNGFAYLFVHDFYVTSDYMPAPLRAFKGFQLASTTGSNWLEQQLRFGNFVGTDYQPPSFDPAIHVGVATWRCYGNFTDVSDWTTACSGKNGDYGRYNFKQGIFSGDRDPISGQLHGVPLGARNGGFLLYPNRWVRTWFFYKQNVNDWDDMTMWMADEVQEPRQELHTMKMSIDGGANGSIQTFWVQLLTSKTEFERPWVGYVDSPKDLQPLAMYHKNLGVHRMPLSTTVEDIEEFLVKPESGA